MELLQPRLIDASDPAQETLDVWKPLKVSKETIDREIERLVALDIIDGRPRAAHIVHPSAQSPGLGFAPGVDVMINVLKPGESTTPFRSNANRLAFCLYGQGEIAVGDCTFRMEPRDLCTIPSMQTFSCRNDQPGLWVWLSYSNAPLLQKLGIHRVDTTPDAARAPRVENSRYTRSNAPDIALGEDGARMRGYEFLTDISVVPNPPLHWPWRLVSKHVAERADDARRGIMLLYNPATERRNGTTHSFFATISSTPPGAPARPAGRGHRHASVAINYHFEGSGRSEVDGETIHWRAGDLLLSGPSWSEHAHYIGEQGARVLTVQDHPLHIGMESLIWQERMDGPVLTLGSEAGQTGYVGPRVAGA
jgi:gentisate 1,2-dioxygenase